MCIQCLSQCQILTEVLPGLALVQATAASSHMPVGALGLVRMDDPDVIWEGPVPTPDPWASLSDTELEGPPGYEKIDDHLVWSRAFEAFSQACKDQLRLNSACRIVELCQKAGYDREEGLEYWLYHRMGEAMARKGNEDASSK